MTTQYNMTITRGDQFVQSFDLYGRVGGYPIEEGDGIYAGNFPIQPWQTSIAVSYSPSANGAWKFIAVPIYRGQSGPPGTVV